MDYVIKTIDTLRMIRSCVKRSERCGKECETCDLRIPTEEALKALNTAIALIDAQKNIQDLIKEG